MSLGTIRKNSCPFCGDSIEKSASSSKHSGYSNIITTPYICCGCRKNFDVLETMPEFRSFSVHIKGKYFNLFEGERLLDK